MSEKYYCVWCHEDLEFDKGRMIYHSEMRENVYGHQICIEKYDEK